MQSYTLKIWCWFLTNMTHTHTTYPCMDMSFSTPVWNFAPENAVFTFYYLGRKFQPGYKNFITLWKTYCEEMIQPFLFLPKNIGTLYVCTWKCCVYISLHS
jgi:hypothetical protein